MKKLTLLFVVAFIVGFVAAPAMAAGKSNVGHLYLYEKTPVTPCGPWTIVPGGAWGKMKYNKSGPTFDFVFNGHGLPAVQPYTLIYYPDIDGDPTFPREVHELGSGTTNGGGNVHIAGSWDPEGDLPFDYDEDGPCPAIVDAKIWLVPTGLLDPGHNNIVGWDVSAILFEDVGISFDDTDD